MCLGADGTRVPRAQALYLQVPPFFPLAGQPTLRHYKGRYVYAPPAALRYRY